MPTVILPDNDNSRNQIIALLKKGEVVAIPTETVYGLGANAYLGTAVAKIFEIKKRPTFNPLIVHYLDKSASTDDVIWNEKAELLYNKFSPGAITYVLPQNSKSRITPLATAGLPSVAVRFPKNDITRALLKNLDFPLAAPSANASGKISPTTAEHIALSLADSNITILNGGKSILGIESTIVSFLAEPTILRHGVITSTEIESVIGKLSEHSTNNNIVAPGMLKKHYAPSKPIRLNVQEANSDEVLICFGKNNQECLINLSKDSNLLEAAANLFESLWQAEQHIKPKIAVMPIPNEGVGIAINDRLKRASY